MHATGSTTVKVDSKLYGIIDRLNAGYTKTDFSNHQGAGTVEDAAARLVKYSLVV